MNGSKAAVGAAEGIKAPHNVIMEDRHTLTVSGISDVDSFDEQTVIVFTDMGELTVKGEGLHINRLSLEVGEIMIEGNISSLSYSDSKPTQEGGFWRQTCRRHMPRQTTNFLLSLGFGFCIGVLYDVVRTIRLIFGGGKRTVLIFDILYSAFAGLVTFIFSLVITNGMVMAYVVFGEMLGFFIYYITFGVFAARFSERVTEAVKGFFIKIFKAIATPFLKLFGFFKRVFGKISQKSRKKAVKAAKKSKIHLKLCGSLLYNQLNNKHNYPKMRKEVKQNGCRKKSGKSKEEKR